MITRRHVVVVVVVVFVTQRTASAERTTDDATDSFLFPLTGFTRPIRNIYVVSCYINHAKSKIEIAWCRNSYVRMTCVGRTKTIYKTNIFTCRKFDRRSHNLRKTFQTRRRMLNFDSPRKRNDFTRNETMSKFVCSFKMGY